MTKRFNLRQVITIPNLLSLCRLVILPLILLLLVQRREKIAFILLLLFWTTDALDGYLARRLHQVTELGRILDPLVDKVSISLIVLTLVVTRGLPIWLALAIVTRDVLILVGSIVIFSFRQSVVPSNVIGKITGFCFASLIAVYVLALKPALKPALYLTSVLVIVSFVNYLVKFVQLIILQGSKETETLNRSPSQ